jgi:hypothetical protein
MRCSCCHAKLDRNDSSWRFGGSEWEHRCEKNIPQAGHFKAEPEPGELLIWHNGYEWVAAYDVEQAKKLVAEMCGDDDPDILEGDGWHVWPKTTIHWSEECGVKESREITVEELLAEFGNKPSYLGSSEC